MAAFESHKNGGIAHLAVERLDGVFGFAASQVWSILCGECPNRLQGRCMVAS
ncbi:MAG: hypothetical protein SPJ97_01270 [Bacteroides sp.]|nr:hypothetical protein [Bacteroides sp.]